MSSREPKSIKSDTTELKKIREEIKKLNADFTKAKAKNDTSAMKTLEHNLSMNKWREQRAREGKPSDYSYIPKDFWEKEATRIRNKYKKNK